jgi:hypothetical protein
MRESRVRKTKPPVYAKLFLVVFSIQISEKPFIRIYHTFNSCYFSLPYYSPSLANLKDVRIKIQTMMILSAHLHLFFVVCPYFWPRYSPKHFILKNTQSTVDTISFTRLQHRTSDYNFVYFNFEVLEIRREGGRF